jgi:AcrR family transcriptional regulator
VSVINAKTRAAVPAEPRWRRRKDERPAEIIAAALASFAERGFAATRLDDIARRAGVTRGTLYLYFASKEELFKAVVRQRLLPVLEHGEQMMAMAGDISTPVLLARLIEAFPDMVIGTPISAIPKLVISEAGNFPDLARFYLDEVIGRGRRLLKAVIARGVARGEFRAVPDDAFFLVVAPMLLTMLWQHSLGRYDKGMLDPRHLARTHADLLLHGLMKPEARLKQEMQ